MPANSSAGELKSAQSQLLLGIDTCGPSGSVALAQLDEELLEIVGEKELEGRSYSATLIQAVGDVLKDAGKELGDIHAIVAVHGPGSFTGVRVGLSAVKGLAEPGAIPVVAVSRLAVLAKSAGCVAAALDAHRGEIFLRVPGPDGHAVELLAGREELKQTACPGQVAVCDESAAQLLQSEWPQVELMQVPAPTAADAVRLAVARIVAGTFVDLALLDGRYLRRSDAEIFGEASARPVKRA